MMHNFIICKFSERRWFFKSHWAKWSPEQVAFFYFQTVTLGLIRLTHVLLFMNHAWKQQIPKLSGENCVTIQLTVRAWSHEWGWLGIPVSQEKGQPRATICTDVYRDWKQCSWAVYYPLSCFSLGSDKTRQLLS